MICCVVGAQDWDFVHTFIWHLYIHISLFVRMGKPVSCRSTNDPDWFYCQFLIVRVFEKRISFWKYQNIYDRPVCCLFKSIWLTVSPWGWNWPNNHLHRCKQNYVVICAVTTSPGSLYPAFPVVNDQPAVRHMELCGSIYTINLI